MLRHLCFAALVSLGVTASFRLLGEILAYTGVLEVLGFNLDRMTWFGFFVAWAGGLTSWYMARDMSAWALNARPLDTAPGNAGAAALGRVLTELAPQLGAPAPARLYVYDKQKADAVAVGLTRSRAQIAVSSGLLDRLASSSATDQQEARVVIAHALAKIGNGDAVAQPLIVGMIAVFSLFPARMLALLLGTSLRTAEEETPSDGVETSFVALLELVFSAFGSLIARTATRLGGSLADRRVAAVLGGGETRAILAAFAAQGVGPHRDPYSVPMRFGADVVAWRQLLAWHRPFAARATALAGADEAIRRTAS